MKWPPLGERGVALALALWLIVLLGAVAAAVVGSTRSSSNVLVNARARIIARYAAESGIVAGVALLQREMASAYSPAQQVAALSEVDRAFADLRSVPLGAARFGVALTNLSGRLDLNQAEPAALVALFSRFTSPAHAGAVVDALQDWRDADDLIRPQGAENDAYRQAGSPYVPRNAPLNRLDEFRRVLGVTDALELAVAPYVTVDGDLLIDVNAAPEEVLAAVPGIGAAGARTMVSRRRGSGPFSSVAEVQSLLGRRGGRSDALPIPRLTVAPSRLLLVSRGWTPGHPLTHEIQAAYAVVGQRLRLQSWRERDL
ncbi:MAG: general secretion pathway protein GspK [Gemmatimonadales bacterium]|nr:general secretion pathway protein GspK [Gemmatimonadales bacterium]